MTTYKQARKSTEAERVNNTELRIPVPLNQLPYEVEKRTIDDLMTTAYRLYNLEEEEARRVLRNAGHTKFNAKMWPTYISVFRQYVWKKAELTSFPDECPICKAEIVHDRKKDYLIGARLGWNCTEDKSHFFQYQIGLLKKKLDAKKERLKNG